MRGPVFSLIFSSTAAALSSHIITLVILCSSFTSSFSTLGLGQNYFLLHPVIMYIQKTGRDATPPSLPLSLPVSECCPTQRRRAPYHGPPHRGLPLLRFGLCRRLLLLLFLFFSFCCCCCCCCCSLASPSCIDLFMGTSFSFFLSLGLIDY